MELIIPWASAIRHTHYQSFYPCISIPVLISFLLVWNESEKNMFYLRGVLHTAQLDTKD